ncbi:MAG: hypothetical protein CVU05_00740 [Bacteroidetes bacterium HGW-Bacteroidetes-21]|jgi:hypothetical protein|nr:MAG: hypothetical protein CVU05_00740 [Bacteroidetes bacterium HGW-Bacteroidetes-21]
MKTLKTTLRILFVLPFVAFLFSCEKDAPTPTKTRMEGVWIVVEAYDSAGTSIMDKFQNPLIPITAVYLGSDNTILSTAGPMVTYMVYGESKWTQISAIIDQCFNYANLTFNGGEFFVADGVVDRFALEMKLEGIGGTSTLVEILNLFNIQAEWLKEVVYHKFLDVSVSFNENNDRMTWELDGSTWAKYNMKDAQGEYVLWYGWPVTKFSRCKFVLEKKVKTLNDVVDEAYNPTTNKLVIE